MRIIAITCLAIWLLATSAFSQKTEPPVVIHMNLPVDSESSEIRKINPSWTKDEPKKLYVPVDLDDSFIELNKMLHPKLIAKLKEGAERVVINEHFGLGIWMRNNWGLWARSRLAKYFNGIGIFHPDDMSGIILTSFQRHLNGRSIELEAQIKKYQDYWEKQKQP